MVERNPSRNFGIWYRQYPGFALDDVDGV